VISSDFRTNRAQFSWSELSAYQDRWVAFSSDGRRVIASGETLEYLEEQLASIGADPQRVVLEWIAGPEDDGAHAGAELF